MGRTLRVMQGVTAGTPAAMALVFVRAGIDVFTTVKATLAVLAAIAVVWLVASDRVRGGPAGFRGRHASLAPPTDFALVAAGLATVLGIATLAAPSPARAVVGEAGRHSGLAVWLAAIVLAVAASIVARHDRGRGLVLVTVAASLPVSVYALSQGVGADLVTWSPVEGGPQVFATLGNADYLSAWLGMVLPLAVATLLDETWPPIWRLTAMAAGLLGLSAAVVSGSLQGPVSGVVGSALVVGMWGGGPGWRLRRRRIAGLGMVLLLVAGVTVALVAVAVSPTGVLASAERSLEARLPIWRAAWDMSGRAPMVGVGPGHFGDYWFTDRPDSAVPVPREVVGASAAADLLERPVDDAHALPLQVAATAGWPAAALWIVALGVAVARGTGAVVSRGGSDRGTAAALLGAVAAVVVTQLVAVDVAPTTVTGWVLIGALAGAGSPRDGPAGRTGGRGGALARRRPAGRGGARTRRRPARRGGAPTRRRPAGRGGARTRRRPLAVAAVTAVTAAAIGIGAVALIPLAADIVAGTAVAAGREGDASAASARWLAASRLAPWERRYPAGHSAWLAERGAFGQALASQRTATRRAPRNRATAVDLARLTRTVRGPQAAVPVYDTVLDIDSRTPVLLAEAGANALAADRPGRAIGLLRRAVESSSPQPSWSARLRQAEAEAQAAAVPAR